MKKENNNTVDCYPKDRWENAKDCPDGGVVGPDDKDYNAVDTNDPCAGDIRGNNCLDSDPCYPWQMTEQSEEACIIEDYIEESITIGGAEVNVHKLLGIYDQKKLIDETGIGQAIDNGSHPNFQAENAFDYFDTEWRSLQTGNDVVKQSFIGYDFGPIRLDNGRLQYAIETYVKRNIATVRLQQGCHSKNRATRVRIERSEDGVKWYGSSVLNIPDCEGAITIRFRASSPSRYWRVRPLLFNGGPEDPWVIRAMMLSESEQTDIENIQDRIFLENRDRAYSVVPVGTKATYTPVDYQAFLAKMGMNSPYNPEIFLFEFSFQKTIRQIGRPIVIGDILEVPSEAFFTPKLRRTQKYLEVTAVSWATTSFTPHWVPTILRVVAQPAMASQETQDIFGDLTEKVDELGTSSINDGVRNKKYQDVHDIDQTIRADANTAVPQKGQDYANKAKLSSKLRDWIEGNIPQLDANKLDRPRHTWGVDGLPPNGEDYTQGDDFPEKPKDGAYHRLTYDRVDQNIAPRLYRFSKAKNRWIFMESDRRFLEKSTKPTLEAFIHPSSSDPEKDNRSDINKISENLDKSIKRND